MFADPIAPFARGPCLPPAERLLGHPPCSYRQRSEKAIDPGGMLDTLQEPIHPHPQLPPYREVEAILYGWEWWGGARAALSFASCLPPFHLNERHEMKIKEL